MSRNWQELLLASSLLLIPTTGHAIETCEPFAIVSPNEGRMIEFIDLEPEGVSPGDFRVGLGPLVNQDGDVVGEIEWIATIVRPDSEGNTRQMADAVLRLATGDILYRMLPERTIREGNITELSVSPVEATRLITGGTGVFANASGDVAWDRDDEDNITFTVNVTCN